MPSGLVQMTTPPQLPIHQIKFPASPSPLLAWLVDSSAPIYTTVGAQPYVRRCPLLGRGQHTGGVLPSGTLYGGVDGPLFHGGRLQPSVPTASAYMAPPASAYGDASGSATHAAAPAPPPPRFYKLEFQTYDGSVDPLNWLNQCDQFFRSQHTLASDRTWLASYHLRGAAQTWYYALEQDEGMPTWEHFKELCNLHFGPIVRGTRLSELARLPFVSTVHDYSDHFNALLCHARNPSTP